MSYIEITNVEINEATFYTETIYSNYQATFSIATIKAQKHTF